MICCLLRGRTLPKLAIVLWLVVGVLFFACGQDLETIQNYITKSKEAGMPASWCFEGFSVDSIYLCCQEEGKHPQCFNETFTYERCCLAASGQGEDEDHAGLLRADLIAYLASHSLQAFRNKIKSDGLLLLPFLAMVLHRGEVYAPEHFLSSLGSTEPQFIVIDVGAHHGEATSLILRWIPHKGDWPCNHRRCISAVVAVEPGPSQFVQLLRMASEHSWSHAGFCALNVALSSAASSLGKFTQNAPSLEDYLMEEGADSESTVAVNVTTLDMLFHEGRCELGWHVPVFLLKIDSEGHDSAILEGAEKLLHPLRVKFILFEFGEAKKISKTLWATLGSLWARGYGCFLVMDHFLVPVSDMWYYSLYEHVSRSGFVHNVDVFCAHPHDLDLVTIVDGFSSSSVVRMARDTSLRAVVEWRQRMPNQMSQLSSIKDFHLRRLRAMKEPLDTNGAQRLLLTASLLRYGQGESPTREDRLGALEWYERVHNLENSRANEDGRCEAAFQIATCYHFADCADKDYTKAKQWYMEAAALGHEKAFYLSRLLPAAFWL